MEPVLPTGAGTQSHQLADGSVLEGRGETGRQAAQQAQRGDVEQDVQDGGQQVFGVDRIGYGSLGPGAGPDSRRVVRA